MNAGIRAWIVLVIFFSIPRCDGADRKIGKNVEAQFVELPFQLKPEDLLKVEFVCEYHPTPSKPWTEEIRISGITGITLTRHADGSAKTGLLHSKQDPQALIALLLYFQDNGFLEMEVNVDPDSKEPIRYIALNIPGRSNKVAIGGRYTYWLGTLMGALRLTAGFSIPEALGKGFFRQL
jgi:hypothetical protein